MLRVSITWGAHRSLCGLGRSSLKDTDAVTPALGLEASKEAGSRGAAESDRTDRGPEAGGSFALAKDGPCVQSHVSQM